MQLALWMATARWAASVALATPEQRATTHMLGQFVFAAGHGYGMGVEVVMEPEKADPLRSRGGVAGARDRSRCMDRDRSRHCERGTRIAPVRAS
jgi:hypothetical protein